MPQFACQHLARLRIIGPALDHIIQVPSHTRLPDSGGEKTRAVHGLLSLTSRDLAENDLTMEGKCPVRRAVVLHQFSHQNYSPATMQILQRDQGDRGNRGGGESTGRTGPLETTCLPCHNDSFLEVLRQQALLAQLAEQLTLNQRVVGSSPTGGILNLTETKTQGDDLPEGIRSIRFGEPKCVPNRA